MIAHRANRDITRCRTKYGDAWREYEQRVPYLFIPVSTQIPSLPHQVQITDLYVYSMSSRFLLRGNFFDLAVLFLSKVIPFHLVDI